MSVMQIDIHGVFRDIATTMVTLENGIAQIEPLMPKTSDIIHRQIICVMYGRRVCVFPCSRQLSHARL